MRTKKERGEQNTGIFTEGLARFDYNSTTIWLQFNYDLSTLLLARMLSRSQQQIEEETEVKWLKSKYNLTSA